jgi:hypothetical protein
LHNFGESVSQLAPRHCLAVVNIGNIEGCGRD